MPTEDLAGQPVRTPVWSGGGAEMVDLMLPAVVGFALSQILLGLWLIAFRSNTSIQQRLYGFFLLSLAGFFLAPFTVDTSWKIATITLMTGVPGLFWLFCASIFNDNFRLQAWQLSLVGITIILPLIDLMIQHYGYSSGAFWTLVLVDIPGMLEFVLVVLALVAVAQHWRVDLVQSRRNLRLWFCGLNGIYILVILGLREVFYLYASWFSYVQYATAAIALLITNGMLLRLRVGLLKPEPTIFTLPDSLRPLLKPVELQPAPVAEEAPPEQPVEPEPKQATTDNKVDVPQDLLDQLRDIMETEHVYRDPDLTIGQLAHRLDLLEYRMRSIINSGLGYRNFNDFLNSYRIREVSQRLKDPEEAGHQITAIAMDAGFHSISTFNKAFKSHFDKTPSAYRREFQAA